MNSSNTKEQCPNCKVEDNSGKIIKVISRRAGMLVDYFVFNCDKCGYKWEERRSG